MFTRRELLQIGAATTAAGLVGCGGGTRRGAAGPSGARGTFERFGVDERMIREGLGAALARGADFADLFFQHRVSSQLELQDGAVNRADQQVELGVGVRAVRGDRTGYGYTEELTAPAIRRAAATAAAIADGPARAAPLELHVPSRLPGRYPVATGWEGVGPERKLPLLEHLNQAVFAADPRVTKVTVSFTDQHGAILVVDSDGRVAEDLQPMTTLRVTCLAEQRGRRESNTYVVAGRAGLELYDPPTLARMVREVVARTVLLFEAVPPPPGDMPVVLAAGAGGILLHEAIGHGMEADFNRKGTSIYADRIGTSIARPFVSIVDDATPKGARGALNVDDEGQTPGTTRLVDGGVLATYLHDRISARHYGVPSTGSGRRESYKSAPMPRMTSTYMLNGPHTRDEIIASVKRGIYCGAFRNGNVKIGAGDFSFYARSGYLIEGGKLTRPIKDVNLIGNGPKVLAQMDMVGDDLQIDEGGWTCAKSGQSVPVSQGMPTVRVASLTVGGRGGD